MEFGKQGDLSGVDFTLPADHPATAKLLRHSDPQPPPQPRVRVGYTAWTHREWVGILYPPEARSADYLHHYARQFSTIELNTTFYRIPDAASVTRWKSAVTPGFRFCPKVFQDISHRHQLFNVRETLLAFLRAIEGFGDHLGPCFLQLPPHFGPAQLPRLEHFLDEWPEDFPLAVEFRHESWFDRNPLAESAFELLQKNKMGAVLTDVAGRRDVLHMHLTAPWMVLRLVGNGLHPTDYRRCNDWTARMKKWFDSGMKDAWIFLHQPDCLHIPEFAGFFIRSVNANCGQELPLLHRYDEEPKQGLLF